MNQVQSLGALLGIVRRRLAILILAVSVGVLGSVVFALTKPPRYETSAKILVVSPQISDELARSTVDLTAAARLRVIEQRMLARDSLSAIIEKHGLFADAPGLNMAKKVELIRASTVIESISAAQGGVSNNDGLVAFTITVSLGNAEQAAAVVNELVASAIEQNLKARAARARDTLIYFEQEARAASLALAEKEVEITAFKKANESALPEGLEASRSALRPRGVRGYGSRRAHTGAGDAVGGAGGGIGGRSERPLPARTRSPLGRASSAGSSSSSRRSGGCSGGRTPSSSASSSSSPRSRRWSPRLRRAPRRATPASPADGER